jgi:hypothetical protein
VIYLIVDRVVSRHRALQVVSACHVIVRVLDVDRRK